MALSAEGWSVPDGVPEDGLVSPVDGLAPLLSTIPRPCWSDYGHGMGVSMSPRRGTRAGIGLRVILRAAMGAEVLSAEAADCTAPGFRMTPRHERMVERGPSATRSRRAPALQWKLGPELWNCVAGMCV